MRWLVQAASESGSSGRIATGLSSRLCCWSGRPPGRPFNLQIDVASWRLLVRILFGPLEELVELLLQHLAVALLRLEALLEKLLPTRPFSLQLRHFRSQIVDRPGFFQHRVRNHGARLRVDFQNRLTA